MSRHLALLLTLAVSAPALAGGFLSGSRSGVGQATITWMDPRFDGDALAPASSIADLDHCIVLWGRAHGGPYAGSSGPVAAGVQTYSTDPALAAGTWYFTVRCYDSSGNPSFYGTESTKLI